MASDDIFVRKLAENDVGLLRRLRRAALADAPTMFLQTFDEAAAYSHDDWHTRARRYAEGISGICFIAERDRAAASVFRRARGDSVKRVIFHPDAEAEMVAAAEFYEARSAGLGIDFIAEVERANPVGLDPIDQTVGGSQCQARSGELAERSLLLATICRARPV